MSDRDREGTVLGEATPMKMCRVLCVEDDAYIAQLIVAVLEHAGYKVEWVADGQTALERITANVSAFDLLITDHRMPRLDGLRLVEKLRQTKFAGRIVVHTSHLSEAEVAHYRRFSVDRILMKPVQLPDLMEAMEGTGVTKP